MAGFASVLVTGANRGLGLEFVKQLVSSSRPPKAVIATCRNPTDASALQDVAKSANNVHVLKLDVADYASYDAFVQEVGNIVGEDGLNLLINNAGIMRGNKLSDVDPKNMIENFEVNVVSPLMLTKALLPLLQCSAQKKSKTIVANITSKMGSIEDNTSGGCYPYRTSKTALNQVSKSLAVDLKPMGILVGIIHPGWVLTDMGGPNALINTETSVSNMLNTISNLDENTSGKFLNYDGKPIPW